MVGSSRDGADSGKSQRRAKENSFHRTRRSVSVELFLVITGNSNQTTGGDRIGSFPQCFQVFAHFWQRVAPAYDSRGPIEEFL